MQKHQLQWKADWLAAHHSAQPAIDASFCAECSETQPPPSSAAASGATTSTPTTSTAVVAERSGGDDEDVKLAENGARERLVLHGGVEEHERRRLLLGEQEGDHLLRRVDRRADRLAAAAEDLDRVLSAVDEDDLHRDLRELLRQALTIHRAGVLPDDVAVAREADRVHRLHLGVGVRERHVGELGLVDLKVGELIVVAHICCCGFCGRAEAVKIC